MKRTLVLAITLLIAIGAIAWSQAAAAAPVRYHLDLHAVPKPGEQFEKTIQFAFSQWTTNVVNGREVVSNSFNFLELKGRERILRWDSSNDISRVEMAVEHFVQSDGARTNRLDEENTKLVGDSILGETFFRTTQGRLPQVFYDDFQSFYVIRPRVFERISHRPLPEQMEVGERCALIPQGRTPKEARDESPSVLDTLTGELQLVGTTNLFGSDCFHIQLRGQAQGMTPGLQEVLKHAPTMKTEMLEQGTLDLIGPLDASQPLFFTSLQIQATITVTLASTPGVEGRSITLQIVTVSRPLGR